MSVPARCIIPHRIATDLISQCRARLPYEACGVLLGIRTEEELTVESYCLLRNVAADPRDSFRFAPDEWIRLNLQTQKNQREIVGLWHSHPSGPALPSAQDAEGWDGCGSYWIVGLEGGRTDLRAYARSGGEWIPIPLIAV
ncbi:Mov34/MPN/PAD-1 family protein [Cohnella thailandensis]|uniref:M67 family metallopeptidase n=1 Tax=Cohnella thailandensis TaxID=557557 RepID=A0A841STT6_9BACL|nr:M67 family metallopeptidase [Cohnella thailandensis]MBB6634006.1 M67 family metallopeptidase [Cohnella thailandensis]MBP1972691.1 proteasome lid subunit RPN8/RPN11 [Cohnella thailandensis]